MVVFVLGQLFLLTLILRVHEHVESVSYIAPAFVYCELWRYIKDGFKLTYCVMGNCCSQNFVDVCRDVTEYVSMVIAWPLNGVLNIQPISFALHFMFVWNYTKLFQCTFLFFGLYYFFQFVYFKFIYVEEE